MTTTRRGLSTPAIYSQTMATRRTVRGHHGYALADLANDAATGHPSQRATVHRNTGGTFHFFYDPRTTARLVCVELAVSWRGSWAPPDGVTVDLSIRDGATAITSASTQIPYGLKGAEKHWPHLGSTNRLGSIASTAFYLDRDALVTAGLSASSVWRLTAVITCDATVYCEGLHMREVSRFVIDDSQAYGEIPQRYLPRAPLDDSLRRIGTTLETAYDLGRRTYHATSVAEASPMSTTATSYAAIPGALSESSGIAASWYVRPRRIKGEPRVKVCARYRTSGAGDGSLRVTTGASASPYLVTLPATSGAWADLTSGVAYLDDADTDTITLDALVASGTLDIVTAHVVDDPA